MTVATGETITVNQGMALDVPREIIGEQPLVQADKTESSLWGYEKAMIVKSLKHHGGNITRVAEALAIAGGFRDWAKKKEILIRGARLLLEKEKIDHDEIKTLMDTA